MLSVCELMYSCLLRTTCVLCLCPAKAERKAKEEADRRRIMANPLGAEAQVRSL